jgi:hypothetical protein
VVIPASLIEFLASPDGMPGFEREPLEHQLVVSAMLLMTMQWHRQHTHYRNAIALPRKAIRDLFGNDKHFYRINRHPHCRYFLVYRYHNGGPKQDNYCNGYSPTPWLAEMFERFLTSQAWGVLLDNRGRQIKSPPRSVASIDRSGNRVTGWKSSDAPALVRVNLPNLSRFEQYWRLLSDAHKYGLLPPEVTILGSANAAWMWKSAAVLRHVASASFPGYILHRYTQARSGRLYAEGPNLQSCIRAARKAALCGCWDYDISCCHFAILQQMAAQYGVHSPHIAAYVRNKTEIRMQLANEAMISVENVKEVLTALIYGARASRSLMTAIPQAIGVEAATRVYKSSIFKGIKSEIDAAIAVILKCHPRKIGGGFVNLFGKEIAGDEPTKRVMAHLLQGVEAVALRAAVRTCPEKVLLLQHDGFATRTQVDPGGLTAAVLAATGGVYRLDFTEELLPPLDLPDFGGAAWVRETKVIWARKAASTEGEIVNSRPGRVTVARYAWDIPAVYPDPWSPSVTFPLPF